MSKRRHVEKPLSKDAIGFVERLRPVKHSNDPHMNEWLKREASRLYQESIIYRLFGRIKIRGKYIFDDRVTSLLYSPLGMFFYNQRAIFLGVGFFFLTILAVTALLLPTTSTKVGLTIPLLFLVWAITAILTIYLHRSFQNKLQEWALNPITNELPPMFDRYFFLDFFLVLTLITLGKLLKLDLDGFGFLLFANTLVWSAYIGGGRRSNRLFLGILLLILVASCFLFLGTKLFLNTNIETSEIDWFYIALYIGPLVGMSLVTVFSVLMISMLRTTEHQLTQGHLKLLGKYEDQLSIPGIDHLDERKELTRDEYSEQRFHQQVSLVLEDICTQDSPFWYYRACLFFIEEHQDRKTLFLPGPRFRFSEANKYPDGIAPSLMGFINCNDLVLHHPSRYSLEDCQKIIPDFRPVLNTPAAFIPLRQEGKRIGVLALYGKEGGPPMQRPEEFLRSLGSIISNTMEQWAGRYRTFPQREMDDLFKCNTLEEVFPLAAEILKRYLIASGCMVVFRENPKDEMMDIVAKDGFTDLIYNNRYIGGRGLTGKCAESGISIRKDDVSKHKEEFDQEHLSNLEKAHQAPIISWMVIPISSSNKSYGVIKVVNSQFRCSWFTTYDENLGKDLAVRLHVIIEKFLQIKETEGASAKAEKHAELAEKNAQEALTAQQKAEASALQLQEDLLTITHQLQGPLIPVIGTLSSLSLAHLPSNLKDKLEHIKALVEDTFILSYGTFTTFALEADQKPAYGTDRINATTELKSLCDRLQKTNARQDLTFYFEEARGFPILQIDRNIFISVLYSLIHNAMKYADKHSEVTLQCGFESRVHGVIPVLKVKSYGEPIHPSEKDTIFKKFQRGRTVSKGRHHTGVGLGLWVARELMKYIGGGLTVELSHDHPKLSIFIVHIPTTS